MLYDVAQIFLKKYSIRCLCFSKTILLVCERGISRIIWQLRMENELNNKKAEHLLSDEQASENLRDREKAGDKEEVLAREISDIVAAGRQDWSQNQKIELGHQIENTIHRYKTRKYVIRLSYAAVFVLAIGLSVFIQMNKESDLRVFARNDQTEISGDIRLILSGEKAINIESDESKIEYLGNGDEIRIDSLEDIRQPVESRELVMNTLVVPYGKRSQITLADGSKVWVNSGSKLIYPARFASDKREVYLEGEAIFEVSHNSKHPFIVVTSDVDVRVLGTVFNVSSYHDDNTINTILESGSVELSYRGNSLLGRSKQMMVPGMMAVYDQGKGSVVQSKVDPKQHMSWREGYFIFDKQPLSQILKKVSRYYNVSIALNNEELGRETFSGYLDLKNSPEQVLSIIAVLIKGKVETIDNQFVITKI